MFFDSEYHTAAKHKRAEGGGCEVCGTVACGVMWPPPHARERKAIEPPEFLVTVDKEFRSLLNLH